MLNKHNHPLGNHNYATEIIILSDVMANKKLKKFNLLLSSNKRILYRKPESRIDTKDYI
jgi:hypothetical protein